MLLKVKHKDLPTKEQLVKQIKRAISFLKEAAKLPTDSGKGRRKDSCTETNLAKARKAKGLKQAEVAKELGLTASAYTKLEHHLSGALAYQRLRELSKLLDVSVDYLISDINVDYNSNID